MTFGLLLIGVHLCGSFPVKEWKRFQEIKKLEQSGSGIRQVTKMPEIISGSKQGNHPRMFLLVQFLKKFSLKSDFEETEEAEFFESHETQLSREKICNPLHQPLKRLKRRNCSHPFTPICTHLHFRDF